jgi:cytochrome bd-type quinol oxidase subunit 2
VPQAGFVVSVLLLAICLWQIIGICLGYTEQSGISDKQMFYLRMWTIASIMLVTVGCIYCMIWLSHAVNRRHKLAALLVLFLYMVIVIFLVAMMVLL